MADFFYFLVSQRRRDAKKLWCARYYFPPLRTLRLGGFARLFFFFLALRAADSFLLAKTHRGGQDAIGATPP
ncbi:MAG: hypothetical protein RJA23_462 [Bacteroidota bacterium]